MNIVFIGCTITREHLKKLPSVWKPIICVLGSYLLMNLVMGTITWKLSGIDFLTALFCTCPGGLSDTTLVAMDMGAVVTEVVTMQMLRVIYGLSVIPATIQLADKVLAPRLGLSRRCYGEETSDNHAKTSQPVYTVLITLSVAAVGGMVGKLSGIPAGTLLFALIFSILLRLKWEKANLPLFIRRCAQVLSGCCIGIRVRREELQALQQLIVPAILMLVAYSGICVLVGILIAKHFDMDLCEGMLCLAPASPSEMTLLAADMHISNPNLIVVQLCRQISAITVFPQVFLLYIKLIG